MRNYETIYIVNPDLADDNYKEVVKKFNDLIEKQKGIIVKVEEWGKQKLAYGVKKFGTGSYVLMNYCGESGTTAELERDLKLDDRIIKFQTVKLADVVDPEALVLERKETEEEIAPEEVSATEEESAKVEESTTVEESVTVEESATVDESATVEDEALEVEKTAQTDQDEGVESVEEVKDGV
jgi:small subunit ribosomal protein S6